MKKRQATGRDKVGIEGRKQRKERKEKKKFITYFITNDGS
jgi:hypothetical protein